MSKGKGKGGRPRKQERTPEDDEVEEKLKDEDFIEDDEVEGDEEEDDVEEYDPEEVYEEEKKPQLDLTKFTKNQLEAYDLNNRRLFFLKALAVDPYQHVPKLSKMCKIRQNTAEEAISVMMGMIGETGKDPDYPERLLKYFNNLVPEGYPNRVQLTPDDVNELTNLFKVMEEKLMNAAKISDPAKIFGESESIDSQTLNTTAAQKKVMMDSASQEDEIPMQGGQPFATPTVERNSMDAYVNKYSIPDIGLMEMALRSVPNPRPNSINSFITNFTDLYTDWMNNPLKILEQLKFFFGPTHGEHAFRLWKDYREKLQKSQAYGSLPNMGMGQGEYQPYGFQQPGQFQPYQLSPELEAERMADRRMDKMMKMLQLKMMDNAMQAQTPMAQMGQSFEEIYDQNGKVIKRIMLPNGHANNGGSQGEMTLMNTMATMFKEMLAGKNQEMVEILKKVSAPDSMLTDFTKTIMSNFVTQQNPASQVKEMLELTNLVKSQAPQSGEAKTLEQTRLEIDSKLAMQELDLKKMEMQHNWRMDEKQAMEQDSNVDKWLNTLQGMGESIIKPVAIKFLEGFGKGQVPGGPLGAIFGGAGQQQPQQQQNPYGMSEQEYAMRQQEYYEQQRARAAEPLQPIPPMGQPQQQRQYNPPPQQQYQQQPPPPQQQQPRPISAASEREIQEELAQLSPQQIQELEDKMMIDDINREKIKNAIKAQKNSRRVPPRPMQQQPQRTAEQVREAQNVLFRNPNELSEEDFGDLDDDFDDNDNDDDDYEVPIARGDTKVPPPTVQKPVKKFSDFEKSSTTDVSKTKKLNDQQKAMYAAGQMTDKELAMLDDADVEEEDDEYSSSGVPMPAGLHNASEEKLVEENLKKTKRSAPKKKKQEEPTVIEKEDEQQEQKQRDDAEAVLKDAEQVLDEAELIPSDDGGE